MIFLPFFFFAAFTCFVAICIPFFGDLLGFFGGFAFAPTTYFVSSIDLSSHFKCTPFILPKNCTINPVPAGLSWACGDSWVSRASCLMWIYWKLWSQLPCIMWLVICKPKRFSLSWITNWVSVLSFPFGYEKKWREAMLKRCARGSVVLYHCRDLAHACVVDRRATWNYRVCIDLCFVQLKVPRREYIV